MKAPPPRYKSLNLFAVLPKSIALSAGLAVLVVVLKGLIAFWLSINCKPTIPVPILISPPSVPILPTPVLSLKKLIKSPSLDFLFNSKVEPPLLVITAFPTGDNSRPTLFLSSAVLATNKVPPDMIRTLSLEFTPNAKLLS